MPDARDGFVALDLDLLVRWYGPNYGTDATGRLALVEIKHRNADLGNGSKSTLRLLDAMLRRGDTERRYLGLYLLREYAPGWRFHGQTELVRDEAIVDMFERQLAGVPRLFG